MKKTKKKIRWLQFFSIFFLISPVISVVGINAKHYFTVNPGYTKVMPQYLEVGLGAILSGIGGGLLVLGKTKPLKGSRGLLFALILAILLKAIISDLILILASLSLGSVIYSAFQPKITEMKEIYKEERQATTQAKAMQNVLEEMDKKRSLIGRV